MTQRTDETSATRARSGLIAWMARNPVPANLLMFVFIIGGLLMSFRVKQEVFPEFDLDMIKVEVPYPGASPEEVEQGIVLAIEENVRGLDGVKRVRGSAIQGLATVQVELLEGADPDRALSDVKNAVDRITSFPLDAERPIVSQLVSKRNVLSLILHGEASEESLRQLAERVRAGLVAEDDIIQVELAGVRPREIAIEVPRAALRAHGLTLEQVAQAVRQASVELPGGSLRTRGGEILVRTAERRDLGREFKQITVLASATGSRVRLGDIATVVDGFRETDQEATFNGVPAVKIDIFRVGAQTPVEVSEAARAHAERLRSELPPGIGLTVWDDRSEIFSDRAELLLTNAGLGLVLVIILLGLMLELRLAFWVMLGIPISFMGAFLLMPALGVSINIVSMFAFIVVLGIVVDDAILVGENIYHKRQAGLPPLQAAIEGGKQVATPVVFAVSTTVVAFGPLLFVPGATGKIFQVIPMIVIAVLAVSLIESLLIVPAHLAHTKKTGSTGLLGAIQRQQLKVGRALQWFIDGIYQRTLGAALRQRYLTAALSLALLLSTVGLAAGGHLEFTFLPKIEGDLVTASVRLPVGASVDDARRVKGVLVKRARQVVAASGGEQITRGLYAQIGSPIVSGVGPRDVSAMTGAHIIDVALRLVPADEREVNSAVVASRWREGVGRLTGVQTMAFKFAIGPSSGAPIDVQLEHPDTRTLERAAATLAGRIKVYGGVKDIDSGFSNGKRQLDVKLKPAGRAMGLTERDMARQLRSALFGAEALRQQRGRDEVRVMVRLPASDRETAYGLEQFRLRTPSGGELPLAQAAAVKPTRAYTAINRVDGRRVLNVTADVDASQGNANKILARIRAEQMPKLTAEFPGLRYSFEGQRRDQSDSMSTLLVGFVGAMLLIYALLAVPFRSYLQPLVVMSTIPFGFIGAVAGHLILGYELSIMSMMGLIALSGVLVNDSLVLIVAANDYRARGASAFDAIVRAGKRRFRPILLTSLTTFFGLMPMIFETSVQARFLIPMAISLGFGVLFVTFLALLLVPALYLAVEDIKGLGRRLVGAPPPTRPAAVQPPAARPDAPAAD